ncbi:MAG: hypothetical protein M1115_10195 [Actinobacteria bacterium]|nr:hypothetical protein [Actinomycetota bacterium]
MNQVDRGSPTKVIAARKSGGQLFGLFGTLEPELELGQENGFDQRLGRL